MNKISKALGAGAGGVLGGLAVLPFALQDGTPWWGTIAAYAAVILLPALAAYIAPKNAS
ncbi:hypothetical protein [Sinorhizobium sp. RAC02]|uniref:hypothetical protein n=1 Tax=Sinorhizobium sp. RAC02 TaxID=1842534 RepID=UPI0008581CEB|nr:hypothetical protein [Sinorhizobium sp. RAC02]AOF88643.1 putative membrane protein [Sinorhizobium sp. RAC02]